MKGSAGASIKFTALHLDGEMDEGWHKHTWEVTCWRSHRPWRDLRSLRDAMRDVVDWIAPRSRWMPWRRRIPPKLWTNEAIADAFLALLDEAAEVHVKRDGFRVRLSR